MKIIKKYYSSATLLLSSLMMKGAFALRQTALDTDGGTIDSLWSSSGKFMNILNYARYGAVVIGIVSIAFMLLQQGNETVTKWATRMIIVASIMGLATSAAIWFGLPVISI